MSRSFAKVLSFPQLARSFSRFICDKTEKRLFLQITMRCFSASKPASAPTDSPSCSISYPLPSAISKTSPSARSACSSRWISCSPKTPAPVAFLLKTLRHQACRSSAIISSTSTKPPKPLPLVSKPANKWRSSATPAHPPSVTPVSSWCARHRSRSGSAMSPRSHGLCACTRRQWIALRSFLLRRILATKERAELQTRKSRQRNADADFL